MPTKKSSRSKKTTTAARKPAAKKTAARAAKPAPKAKAAARPKATADKYLQSGAPWWKRFL